MSRMRPRRGSALILVLLMTLAVAALAIAAIFMTSSAGLLSRFYDRERLFRYAAESALEITRSRLEGTLPPVVPDTGVRVMLSGWQPRTAAGAIIAGVSVNVYAANTGDTSGTHLPFVTLIAQAYDASGTRQVRRMDLRRESFSRYQYFVDSFPSGLYFGPGVVGGRVHSNTNWINSSSGATFLDTVSVAGSITGTGSFEIDSLPGAPVVLYPKDSTFARLDTLAQAAGLSFATAGLATRVEFSVFDADNDGTVEPNEGFFKVLDLLALDASYIEVAPSVSFSIFVPYYRWTDPRIQKQCGAFYLIGGRWEFYPVAVHRVDWVQTRIATSTMPNSPNTNQIDEYDDNETMRILGMPTARCFPIGSPYLMLTERFTDAAGQYTGVDANDTRPFGNVAAGGRYGGMDSTFTAKIRTCDFSQVRDNAGVCAGGVTTTAAWRAGTSPTGVSTAVRQAAEHPYLWAYGSGFNSASRGVISVSSGTAYISGSVTGRVTLRSAGSLLVVGDLRYESPPNQPESDCTTQLGVVAVGDILVVDGMLNRTRRVGEASGFAQVNPGAYVHGGPARRTTLHGTFMSLTGTVGVNNPAGNSGVASNEPPCPEGSTAYANGGCFALVGGAVMKRYSMIQAGSSSSGFRFYGTPDRCQNSTRRPPFFPGTNRYTRVRTLEVQPRIANTPPKIRSLLLRLKGKSL